MTSSNLLNKIKTNNKARAFIIPMEATAIVLLLALAVALTDAAVTPPEYAFNISIRLFLITLPLSIFTYIFFRIRYKTYINSEAAKLDFIHNSKNRMEAAIELEKTNNLLKQHQLKNTENFFQNRKIFSLIPLLCLLFFIIGILLFMHTFLVTIQFEKSIASNMQVFSVKKFKKFNLLKKNNNNDFAEIEFISPESEKRAKPMDVIEWQAKAFSSNGFNSISISIFLNGDLIKNIPVKLNSIAVMPEFAPGDFLNEDSFKKITVTKPQTSNEFSKFPALTKNKNIIFSGEFYLDQLNVMPFDLISYNITAFAKINESENDKILSQPQFIEIRPFREDAEFLKLKNSKLMNKKLKKLLRMLALINKFLNYQLSINKALFAIRASGLKPENKILIEQINMLAKDQKTLKIKLDKMLKNIPAEYISSNMLDYLSQATEQMKTAADAMENIK